MGMSFDLCVEIVIKAEGGYNNNPYDPGSTTKYGISARAYPGTDIVNLTRDAAIKIYRRDYWEKGKVESLPSSIHLLYFDACVNQGIDSAVRCLQKAVGARIDGILGPDTRAAIQNTESRALIALYAQARHDFYTRLRGWEHFGKGWSRRLLEMTIWSYSKVGINV